MTRKSQQKNPSGRKKQLVSNLLVVLILTLPVLSFLIYWSQRQHRDRTSKGYAIQYPVVTHFPRPFLCEPDLRRRPDLGWGRYNNAVTDDWTPLKKEVKAAAMRWEGQARCGAYILNVPDKVQSDFRRMQVVNNVRIDSTLWTFLISPFWKKEAGPYLLIVSANPGTSSNNRRLYQAGRDAVDLPTTVARLGMAGYPVVAAVVNCGGRESQGNHPSVLHAVGEGISYAADHFSVDRGKVVFVGKSRGGFASLLWAANPLGLNYSAAAVFAHAPATDFATLLAQPVGTFPALAKGIFDTLGPRNRASPGYGPEFLALLDLGKRVFAGGPGKERMRSHSPIAYVEKLRGKYVALGFGTHDSLLGLEQGFDFAQALDRKGVPFYAEFILGSGHENSPGVRRAFNTYLQNVLKHQDLPLPHGREWTADEAIASRMKSQNSTDSVGGRFFWAVFPRATTALRPNALYLGGTRGAKWSARASASAGSPAPDTWIRKSGVFSADYVRVELPAPPGAGLYQWEFGLDGVTIPANSSVAAGNDGTPLPLVTRVLQGERSLQDLPENPEGGKAFGCAWFNTVE